MRRGNGDGSIFKLSGKRRRPYAVRVTICTVQNEQIQINNKKEISQRNTTDIKDNKAAPPFYNWLEN